MPNYPFEARCADNGHCATLYSFGSKDGTWLTATIADQKPRIFENTVTFEGLADGGYYACEVSMELNGQRFSCRQNRAIPFRSAPLTKSKNKDGFITLLPLRPKMRKLGGSAVEFNWGSPAAAIGVMTPKYTASLYHATYANWQEIELVFEQSGLETETCVFDGLEPGKSRAAR